MTTHDNHDNHAYSYSHMKRKKKRKGRGKEEGGEKGYGIGKGRHGRHGLSSDVLRMHRRQPHHPSSLDQGDEPWITRCTQPSRWRAF